MFRIVFRLLCLIGRPFGGLRPRRFTHWVAKKAYNSGPPQEAEFSWVEDQWRSKLLLHPYYLQDYNIIAFGCYDRPLHLFFERFVKPGMVCFDVGANIGEMSLHLARLVGARGKVHSFEPLPEMYRRLTANINENGLAPIIKASSLAISRVSGKTVIRLANVNARNQGMGSLVNSANPELSLSSEIETTTLDEYISSENVSRLDLMKVDIQGAEPLLLEGGNHTLRSLAPDLLMEISPEDLKGLGLTSKNLLQSIEGLGYRAYQIRSDGQIGALILAQEVADDFSASNVFCTKRGLNEIR